MILSNLPAFQVLLPLIGALVSAMIPRRNFAYWFSLGITFLSFVISLFLIINVNLEGNIRYDLGGWPIPKGIEYNVDYFNVFILLILNSVAFFSIIYSRQSISLDVERKKVPYFYTIFLLCLTGLNGMVMTNDAFNIYVFLEIASLSIYTLIALGRNKSSLVSSFEYLILGSIGATFILIAIGILYMVTGSLNITDISVKIQEHINSVAVKASLAFFIVGIGLKIAMFPKHIWLVNSYTNAPTVVSVFLSATATKVSLYILLRVIFTIYGVEFTLNELSISTVLIVLSVIAILYGSLVAIFQTNIKRMLAFSSVAQVGYLVLAFSISEPMALTAGLIHLFAHAYSKSALFMYAGIVEYYRKDTKITSFNGFAKFKPLIFIAFIISAASLVGIPGTLGFISKWLLIVSLIDKGYWYLVLVVVLSSIFALCYIWQIIDHAVFSKLELKSSKKIPITMMIPIWFFALTILILGVYTEPIISTAKIIANYLFMIKG